jgi:DNA-binding CsgD family transcriptional regulator
MGGLSRARARGARDGDPVSRIRVRMSLLGRATERAVLDRLIADVRRGESRSVVLRGEAGIGKTALLNYLVESAPDLTVDRAVGVESEMELAFASLHQLCAPMLDRLPRLPSPQRQALEIVFGLSAGAAPDRFLVGLAVLSLLSEAADERPLLCVVDDAQWLDHASALTLAFVARRLVAERVGIAFAAREPVEELRHLPELEVHGLRNEDARALLSAAVRSQLDAQVRDRIIAETRGNPLALLELPHGLTATELAGGFGLLGGQALTGRIEESYIRRFDALADETQRLVLIAAAEPVGDPLLLMRAADRLRIRPTAAEEAEAQGLLAIGERVTFRHPLARSAVYRSATAHERRTVHRALAAVTERSVDPDRRAWHLAAAAAGPDEEVAGELVRSAGRAKARGGLAAAAAFLTRAVHLTADPMRHADRALAAGHASLQAGAFDAALGLLAAAEAGALDDAQRARVALLRAEIAFASSRGSSAPALLLRAAKRMEPFDARLARAGYLEAMSAAMFAARLARTDGGVREVAHAVQEIRSATPQRTAADLLLDGWAALFTDGCAAATPTLREALTLFEDATAAGDHLHLLWLATITAPVVWDDKRWDALSGLHVARARSSGALSELPLALNSRIYIHLFRGELETADVLIGEARAATEATGASLTPWGAVALAALRGREQDAAAIIEVAAADATKRGEGIGLTVIAWTRAILYNGLGVPDKALAAARAAIDCPTNSAAAAWGMVEFIEAAARRGETQAAAEIAGRFGEIVKAAETEWALGVHARSLALLSAGRPAEQLYREALDRLGRCPMRVDLARAHLLYGEWLRREQRRVDARTQLRGAHDQFTSMGMEGFAERARRELFATGEKARKRSVETRDELTAQEQQIARLARDGLSNPEIGARLFLSPRTVEWHLRKVFSKLEIRSRHELSSALPSSESELAPA